MVHSPPPPPPRNRSPRAPDAVGGHRSSRRIYPKDHCYIDLPPLPGQGAREDDLMRMGPWNRPHCESVLCIFQGSARRATRPSPYCRRHELDHSCGSLSDRPAVRRHSPRRWPHRLVARYFSVCCCRAADPTMYLLVHRKEICS